MNKKNKESGADHEARCKQIEDTILLISKAFCAECAVDAAKLQIDRCRFDDVDAWFVRGPFRHENDAKDLMCRCDSAVLHITFSIHVGVRDLPLFIGFGFALYVRVRETQCGDSI